MLAKLTQQMIHHLNNYVPIALFLTISHKLPDLGQRLFWYDKQLSSEIKEFNVDKIMTNELFMEQLVFAILKYEESQVFAQLLDFVEDWEVLFTNKILELFMDKKYVQQLQLLLTKFNEFLTKRKNSEQNSRRNQQRSGSAIERSPSYQTTRGDSFSSNLISKDKIVKIVQCYFEFYEENDLILDILHKMNLSLDEVVDVLMSSKNEDRFMNMAQNDENIRQRLSIKKLKELRQYKLLTLMDRMQLINVFDEPLVEGTSSPTVYEELCNCIKRGERIQSLSFVIMHVSYTFWSLDKLFRFYNAINEALRSETKTNLLLYIHNPLLFYIRLVYFFKKISAQLDTRSKDIQQLCDNLLEFCLKYIEGASDETLLIDINEKDPKGREFLEYVFIIKELKLVEIEFIEKLIYQMWDLGRHSLQTVRQFMRLNTLPYELTRFSLSGLKRDFSMPIEASDRFQVEFVYTSNSVFLRVLSGIIWPLCQITIEFIFNLQLIDIFRDGRWGSDWLKYYYSNYNTLFWIQVYLRANHLVNLFLKIYILGKHKRDWLYLRVFYQLMLALYVFQMGVISIFIPDHFYTINFTQMLITCLLVVYVLYYCLSLNEIGVILRIFIRMVYVVVVFGSISCILITFIAYPIHVAFIQFSDYGSTSMQLNMFYDLYNGILTMFEFVFGAVIFVRPYSEQNGYTYAMTFVMVIFSFFGNIMLANLMIAFLASQYDNISKHAQYYTLRMQYGLIKIFGQEHVDGALGLPYPFTLLMLPMFLLMVKPGQLRTKVNRLMRKFIYFVNIFIPTVLCMTLYLVIVALKRYFDIAMMIIETAIADPLHIFYLPVWLVVGGPFLTWLFVLDIATMLRILTNFRSSTQIDILNITLNEDEKVRLVKTLSTIEAVTERLVNEKGMKSISLKNFLFEIGVLQAKDLALNSSKLVPKTDLSLDIEEEGREDEPKQAEHQFMNLFKAKFSQDQRKLYPLILKKYINKENSTGTEATEDLDLVFMLKKFKGKIDIHNIHKLISFDRQTVETARKVLQPHKDPDSEVKAEVKRLAVDLAEVKDNVSLLVKLALKQGPCNP